MYSLESKSSICTVDKNKGFEQIALFIRNSFNMTTNRIAFKRMMWHVQCILEWPLKERKKAIVVRYSAR